MKDVLLVFVGGGFGSILRFGMSKWINSLHAHHFPWGTLAVNVLACALMGLVLGLADQRQLISPSARLFWTVGFFGGFSTFSAFTSEAITLIEGQFHFSLVLYLVLSLTLCITAAYAGMWFGGRAF